MRAVKMTGGLVVAIFIGLTGHAGANDYSESDPWQFQTTQDRANKALIADLIARQEADLYEITNVYNIAGDYVNCTQSANSVGNTETIAQEAPIGSPRISVDGQIGSESAGNAGSTDMVGGSAGIPQSGMNSGIARASNGGSMAGSSQVQRATGESSLRSSSSQALTGNASETVQNN